MASISRLQTAVRAPVQRHDAPCPARARERGSLGLELERHDRPRAALTNLPRVNDARRTRDRNLALCVGTGKLPFCTVLYTSFFFLAFNESLGSSLESPPRHPRRPIPVNAALALRFHSGTARGGIRPCRPQDNKEQGREAISIKVDR